MFTYDLWGSTAMLAKGDEREFYMAHRPKMVLRSVRIERDEKGNPLGIICVLVNAGDTPAVITSRLNYNVDSLGRYSVNKTLSRAIPAYGDIWHDIPKQIFKPEERLPIFIPFESVQVDGMSGRQILLGNKALHFYGFIAFSNELRTDERPHAFYWIYNPDTMKFAESENDEYGY